MNLYVDIGNSRIKWARGGTQLHDARTCALDADWVRQLTLTGIRQIIVASVAGATPLTRLQALAAARDIPVHVAETSARAGGVRNAYREPQAHGVDRWMTCIAAHARGTGSVLIADAGTATTLDWVDARGRHGGGLIAPGIGVMQGALRGNTRLQFDQVPTQDRWLATDTAGAIALGTLRSTTAMLDNAAAELAPDRLLLTGGDAERLAPYLAGCWQQAPQLVLEGLACYARHHLGVPQ